MGAEPLLFLPVMPLLRTERIGPNSRMRVKIDFSIGMSLTATLGEGATTRASVHLLILLMNDFSKSGMNTYTWR